MKNFYILTDAIHYIEENLCNDFTLEEVAASCYSSLSGLKKLFAYAFHMGLREYISKRRMTHAAHDILNTGLSITEIAYKYQYNSPEVFTRAFSKVWDTSPSAFKKQWRFSGLFPRILFEYDGGMIMSRRKVDLSELYDLLKSRKDSYVLGFDIKGLMPINENYGREAGDKAILECLRRLDSLTDDSCFLFRIGGDQFALVTDLTDPREAEQLARKVLALNNTPILHNGTEIPVSMRVGGTKIEGSKVRHHELFTNLNQVINEAARGNTECYIQ
ncbi:AraC family transcriptional regulator [Anaerotaenia torta]|uniref:helix-turn-helix domain-containing protein n=1 Tax=Anaerotaenia torta TaxID=433293 RepID=UPI003D2396CB